MSSDSGPDQPRPFRVCPECGRLTPSSSPHCVMCGAVSAQAMAEQVERENERRFAEAFFRRGTSATWALIGANVAVFLLMSGGASAGAPAGASMGTAPAALGDWRDNTTRSTPSRPSKAAPATSHAVRSRGSARDVPTAWPQPEQNRAAGEICAPHPGHDALDRGAPQLTQNFPTPGTPQDGQGLGVVAVMSSTYPILKDRRRTSTPPSLRPAIVVVMKDSSDITIPTSRVPIATARRSTGIAHFRSGRKM